MNTKINNKQDSLQKRTSIASIIIAFITSTAAPLSHAQNLVTSLDFNEKSIIDKVSSKQNYDTGLENEGDILFSNESSITGYGLEVDFLRYLHLPFDVVSHSKGKFTVKYDYYHIRSTAGNTTAWHSHSFAINDKTNGYAWSHGFRNLGNDYWSSAITGFSKVGSQSKGDANLIPDFNANSWHEYVLVFDGTRLSWYVDGVFAYYQEFNKSFADWDFDNSGIVLGARYQGGTVDVLDGRDSYLGLTGTNTHLGSVNAVYDNVRIWDSALSAEDIANGVENLLPEEPYTLVLSNAQKLSSNEQTFSLNIESNQAWQVTSLPSWLSVEQSSGENDAILEFTLSENIANEARHATLLVNNNPVEITQSAKLSEITADAVIFPDTKNQEIEYVFYDLKSHFSKTMTESTADKLYTIDGFNGVRTSIYGTQDKPDTANGKPAHPEAGVVLAEYYAPEVSKIKQAMARNSDMIVFASKKLNGQYSFPDWVLSSTGIIPDQYAILLADYIEYMASEGIPTHILGIDNEYLFNEGKIWPSRFHETVEILKELSAERNFPMPIIIGYEDFGPGKNNWMKNIVANGWIDDMDIYGTHYYPEDRNNNKIALLESDLKYAGNKDRWHSELHWNTKSNIDDILEIEDGFGSLLDMTDRGFNGLIWWGYGRSNLRGNIMRRLTTNLLGYSPITMTDHDGTNILTDGKLHTRAYRNGNTIRGWILNMNEENNFEDYQFSLTHGAIAGNVSYIQYTESVPWGVTTNASNLSDKAFSLNIAPMSVTNFVLTLDEESSTEFFAESWDDASELNLVSGETLQADNQWSFSSNSDGSMSIQQQDKPLTENALVISSINDSDVNSSLTSEFSSSITQDSFDALTLKLKFVFTDKELSKNDSTVINLTSDNLNQLYSLVLTSDESKDYIATLVINGEQGERSIELGLTEAFVVGVPYDISVTLTKVASNQTNISYAIHRDRMFWSEGETFVNTAVDDSSTLSALTINAQHQSILTIDDISLSATNLIQTTAAVEGDINGDGTVTTDDIMAFLSVYGLTADDEGYLSEADLDNDGVISRLDYSKLYRIYIQQ